MTMANKTQKLLRTLTADYQVFYQKLRAYHWTVTGPLFFGLHEKFELMYNDAALKVDELAERLLAKGGHPTATLAEALGEARLKEAALPASAETMVADLLEDFEKLSGWLTECFNTAEAEGDPVTMNVVDGFRDEHAKSAWMLRAFLGGEVHA